MKRSIALRIGRALLALHELKCELGVDWCVHSSWTSDQPVVVALLRPAGWARSGRKPLGKPVVAADLDALLRAAAATLKVELETLKRKRKEKRRGPHAS